MRVIYFDGEAGASGDMILGALFDLGVDFAPLLEILRPVIPARLAIDVERVQVCGIAARKVIVRVTEEAAHRTLADILLMLGRAALDAPLRDRCAAIFRRLAEAEAHVHNTSVERLHFHEVGGNDAIVDVIGAVWALGQLNVNKVFSVPLVLGSGVGRSTHGPITYPAPAVMEILRDRPVRLVTGLGETTTPTGAAVLAEIAEFTDDLALTPSRVGYGTGTYEFTDRPNLLRATLGETPASFETDHLWLGTSDIDNTRPEIFDWLLERLRAAGAVDVVLTDVAMKKNRRGIRVDVLCDAPQRAAIAEVILGETGSLGLRWSPVWRMKLPRRLETVATPWGPIRVKVALTSHGPRGIPEYDDCRTAAAQSGEPLWKIYDTVNRLFLETAAEGDTSTQKEG